MTHRQTRVAIGSVLVSLIVGLVFLDRSLGQPAAIPAVATLLGVLGTWEFGRLCGDRLGAPLRRGLLCGGALALVLVWAACRVQPVGGGAWLAAAPAVALLAVAVALFRSRWRSGVEPQDLAGIALCALGVLVAVLPLASLTATTHLPHGVLFAVVMVLGSKLNDMGGYLVGSSLGRHRLCPGISPNKTWEGAVGGLVAGVFGTVALVHLLDPLPASIPWTHAMVLGLVIGLGTQLGDLFESSLKRAVGVKDSAALIPTFGGVLDLVDSLIFAAPLGYAMGHAWLFAPP